MKLGTPTCRFCTHFVNFNGYFERTDYKSTRGVCTKYPQEGKERPIIKSTDFCSKFSEWQHPEVKTMIDIQAQQFTRELWSGHSGSKDWRGKHEIHELDRFIC